jgi:Hemerythrin HHE cation binding domain
MTSAILPRRPDEPAPDLLDYVVVHRAMTTDIRRLAEVADAFARGREPLDADRAAAFRDYLAGIDAEIRSHHRIEDDHAWPFLVSVTGEAAGLAELTADHGQLDPLLLADAGPPLRLLLRVVGGRFAAQQRLVFG